MWYKAKAQRNVRFGRYVALFPLRAFLKEGRLNINNDANDVNDYRLKMMIRLLMKLKRTRQHWPHATSRKTIIKINQNRFMYSTPQPICQLNILSIQRLSGIDRFLRKDPLLYI